MTLAIGILFGLIVFMILLFAFEVFSVDIIGLLIMVSLMLLGIFFPEEFVTPQEGLSGMSNTATVTVLSLMMLSAGLENTGVIQRLGTQLKPLLLSREWVGILLLMVVVGFFSAFIATTAVVIVFLRMLVEISDQEEISLPRYLIPLSFAGILGGSSTLLGTSTNLLVSGIARNYDIPPIGVFEFTGVGLIFFFAAVVYMLVIGRHLLPPKKEEEKKLLSKYALEGYLTELTVGPDSLIIGEKFSDTELFKDTGIELVDVRRGRKSALLGKKDISLAEGDTLLVKGTAEKIAELISKNDGKLNVRSDTISDERFADIDVQLCEVMILPNSSLIGRPLGRLSEKLEYHAVPLAVKRNLSGTSTFRKFLGVPTHDLRLRAGDSVLLEVEKDSIDAIYNSHGLVVLQEFEKPNFRANKAPVAVAIMVLVVLIAALGILPIVVSALAGCLAMFLTRCLNIQTAYERVDWSVFFLLSGMIPLGIAMDNSGASKLIAENFIFYFDELSPRMLVGVVFGCTALMSAFISNNATAIIIAPVAISIAYSLEIDPRPLLFTVMFGANTSYMTPVGYQTNTLIYGPGGYRFVDFLKVGGLLTLIIFVLATLLIPAFYF